MPNQETDHGYGGSINDAWIETFTGRRFNVFNPDPNDVDIRDIAHALSCNNRFNGHLRQPVSVAEHSYFVSKFVSTRNRFIALLHDASEAYLSDVPRPIKQFFSEVKLVEQAVERTIFDKFGIRETIPEEVKLIDSRMCASEALDSGFRVSEWSDPHRYKPLDHIPKHWTPIKAESMFLIRFRELEYEYTTLSKQRVRSQLSTPRRKTVLSI